MTSTTQLERNTQHSFAYVKQDIHNMYEHIRYLYAEIERLKTNGTKKKNGKKRTASTNIVASKTGKKIHNAVCVFGKKIRHDNLVTFTSIKNGVSKGYNVCSCLA